LANFITAGSPSSVYQTLYSATALTATAAGDKIVGVERYTSALFQLETGTGTGTSPTLDVYIQTLCPDNTTWQDILHFAQCITAATHQIGWFVTGSSSVAAIQTAALAASTIKSIGLGGAIRVRPVVGGTNPSYATVICYASFYE
jgi:hypothetical protein